ncbi:MAG TPA: ABC transporter permease [Thermoanaerobaculia bacterium]|nr:ABC transporter permease [Thermoanaerobaculia bacterium]
MAGWRRSFRLHLRGGTVERDVDEEIAFHVETRTEELIEQGMSPSAAREEALRCFGDLQGVRRSCLEIGRRRQRGRRRLEILSEMRQDAAFALRQLAKTPAFTLVAVLTLALGIGATATIFSVLHAVVLRPLPFPEPERIVHLWATWQGDERSVSPGGFLEFRRSIRSFEHLAALHSASFNLTGEGAPERIEGGRVSAGYFDVFGIRPALGRVFSAQEDQPGHERVVVLSHRLWRGRFGSDPGILGQDVRLSGQLYRVIGVMPAVFELRASDPELWVPLALGPDQAVHGNSFLVLVGRLRRGASPESAAAEAAVVAKRLEKIDPQSYQGKGTRIEPLLDRLLGSYRRRLLVLLGAVGCVLAIAAVNVANLLLARGAGRSREIAIRASLGAGRGRIVRQLLTESAVLGLAGAAAGLGLAGLGVQSLVAISPANVPRLEAAGIDGTVLGFTVALGLASVLLFGLVPALRTARPDLQTMLKEGGRSLGSGLRDRVRSSLLVVEVALALMLLVGAGLLIRSAVRLQQVEIGFDPEDLLTAQVSLPTSEYAEPARLLAAVEGMRGGVEAIPGVRSASVVSLLPLSRYNLSSNVRIEGKPRPPGEEINGDTRSVTPGYFRTLGISLLQGRDFTDRDRASSPGVVIVNQRLAEMAWPGESPLGKRLDYTGDLLEVIAVAGDIRAGGLEEEVRPAFYVPLAQFPKDLWGAEIQLALAARTDGEPAAKAEALRRAVQAVDPKLPVFGVRTMGEIRSDLVATTRFNTMLLAALGVIGLALAAVGIYGVIAYFVSQRTAEIGLRMALGATEKKVLAMVVRQALQPVLVGVTVGIGGGLMAGRALASLLFGVSATDPATFAGVVLVLVTAALLASWVPARRAARVDPTRALAP